MRCFDFSQLFLLLIIRCVFLFGQDVNVDQNYPPFGSASQIRSIIAQHMDRGEFSSIIERLERINASFGTLYLDKKIPSIYSYYGVALYNAKRVTDAQFALEQALYYYPNDTRSWINLGEIRIQTFQLSGAIHAFNEAFARGELSALPRLLRTKGWGTSWERFDMYTSDLEKLTHLCYKNMSMCAIDCSSGFEYADVPGEVFRQLTSMLPHAQDSKLLIDPIDRASVTSFETFQKKSLNSSGRAAERLKVGFISSDFGVHPVSTLIRGLLHFLSLPPLRQHLEVYCFSLQPFMSWWGSNISQTVEHFQLLPSMDTRDAAVLLAQHRIDILIDLNGHTIHSGLSIMSYRPAPVQVSYLGLPTTTGASFIDYYLSDLIATPPEHQAHYSEQLVLASFCYIANDYAQVQGEVGKATRRHRADRSALPISYALYEEYIANVSTAQFQHASHLSASAGFNQAVQAMQAANQSAFLSRAQVLLATLSNSQKMDPAIFTVWMNILQRFPDAGMLFMDYAAHRFYMPELFTGARFRGVEPHRLFSVQQSPWIDHLFAKTSLDLVLDTVVKNGHTTGLDGVWAGLPTISLAHQASSPARAAQSIATTLGDEKGLAFSLKDYEDIAFSLLRQSREAFSKAKHSRKHRRQAAAATGPEERWRLLYAWKDDISPLRLTSRLFDTRLFAASFAHLLQALYDSHYASLALAREGRRKRKFHVFASRQHSAIKSASTATEQLYDAESVHFPFPPSSYPPSSAPALPPEQSSKECKYHHKEGTVCMRAHWPDLPKYIFDGRMLMLNIGGIRSAKGWLNVNFPVSPPSSPLDSFLTNSLVTLWLAGRHFQRRTRARHPAPHALPKRPSRQLRVRHLLQSHSRAQQLWRQHALRHVARVVPRAQAWRHPAHRRA
jgi:predicted O-linked N-acetylglucosamine transferase (SPINDLY family)